MPSQAISDAWVRNLTWSKAIRALEKEQKSRHQEDEAFEFKEPVQITYIHTLQRGLALVMVFSAGGTKTFRALVYRNGKPHSVKLGSYPDMTVAKASEAARTYWKDPKKFEAQAEVGSFKEVAENWVGRYVAKNKLRSQPEIERILARYVYPKWGSRPFLEIGRSQVSLLLDHVEDHHGVSQANAMLAVLRALMNWHQKRSATYVTPVVKGMQRGTKQSRKRILTEDEIRAVWKAADGIFGAYVKTLLLTGQRRTKVANMRREHIDANGIWSIPSEAREKGTAGRLKLPALALDVIAAVPEVHGNPFVFPAARGRGALRSFDTGMEVLCAKLPNVPHWTLHDLRRTARSLMSRKAAGVLPHIAEQVLGHTIKGVQGIYDQYDYFDEKTDALQKLAALIQSIVTPPPANVVPPEVLRKKRAKAMSSQ